MAYQPLAGQRALVTGANSGIGEGVAKCLGAAGAKVVVNYVTAPDAAEAVVKDIVTNGGQAIAIKADVSKEAEVEAMFQQMFKEWGGIDICVNNAGLQRDSAFTEMTLDQWNFVLAVNLTGQFLCSRAAGKIICMSSVHELIPWSGHVNYASSKGGMRMFMQSLAQELAPFKIRVNSIGPGAIATPINRPAWETPEALASLCKLIPYGRVGVPDDIGKVTVFLASDDADYIQGQTIMVDGGMTLFPEFAHGG
jgi:glucose 1-dehydrogenase